MCCSAHCSTLLLLLLHYCTTLSYIKLNSTKLYYSSLYCSVSWYCIELHCLVLNCTVLHCTTPHFTVLHLTALHCTALHCTALHYSALPPLAVVTTDRGNKTIITLDTPHTILHTLLYSPYPSHNCFNPLKLPCHCSPDFYNEKGLSPT